MEGLYRYAMEMVLCQGTDSENEIRRNRDLIQEIAAFWHCDALAVIQMRNQIDKSLRGLECSGTETQAQDIK